MQKLVAPPSADLWKSGLKTLDDKIQILESGFLINIIQEHVEICAMYMHGFSSGCMEEWTDGRDWKGDGPTDLTQKGKIIFKLFIVRSYLPP